MNNKIECTHPYLSSKIFVLLTAEWTSSFVHTIVQYLGFHFPFISYLKIILGVRFFVDLHHWVKLLSTNLISILLLSPSSHILSIEENMWLKLNFVQKTKMIHSVEPYLWHKRVPIYPYKVDLFTLWFSSFFFFFCQKATLWYCVLIS